MSNLLYEIILVLEKYMKQNCFLFEIYDIVTLFNIFVQGKNSKRYERSTLTTSCGASPAKWMMAIQLSVTSDVNCSIRSRAV